MTSSFLVVLFCVTRLKLSRLLKREKNRIVMIMIYIQMVPLPNRILQSFGKFANWSDKPYIGRNHLVFPLNCHYLWGNSVESSCWRFRFTVEREGRFYGLSSLTEIGMSIKPKIHVSLCKAQYQDVRDLDSVPRFAMTWSKSVCISALLITICKKGDNNMSFISTCVFLVFFDCKFSRARTACCYRFVWGQPQWRLYLGHAGTVI